MKSLEERFAQAQDGFDKAGPYKPEPGIYKCVILENKLRLIKDDYNLIIKMIISEPVADKGKTFDHFMKIEGQYVQSFKIFMDVIGEKGYQLKNLPKDVEANKFVDMALLVNVKPNVKAPEYPYINIQKRLESTDIKADDMGTESLLEGATPVNLRDVDEGEKKTDAPF